MNLWTELKLLSGANGLKNLIEDHPHSAGPSTSKDDRNVWKHREVVVQVGISKSSCHEILMDNLDMQHVALNLWHVCWLMSKNRSVMIKTPFFTMGLSNVTQIQKAQQVWSNVKVMLTLFYCEVLFAMNFYLIARLSTKSTILKWWHICKRPWEANNPIYGSR
jgi:hypothetical protein